MQWLQAHKHRMDSFLFHNLLDKYHHSRLDSTSITAVLIKLKSNKKVKTLKDLCRLHPLDKEGVKAPALNFLSAKLSFHTIQLLTNHVEIEKLYLDREVHAFLDKVSQSIEDSYAKKVHRLSGKGVTIAMLDTGIHEHPDFTMPNNRILEFVDYVHGRSLPYDDNGHGTHVAGCAAGNGYASNGKYMGIAPEAQIVGIKVMDESGKGFLSSVLAGINYCIENKSRLNIRIINLSLGTELDSDYKEDPFIEAAEKAVATGIVVLIAAESSGGNIIPSLPTDSTIISVGAVADRKIDSYSENLIYTYTSNLKDINGLRKSDVFLPGIFVTAPLSPNSILSAQLEPFVVNENYISLSGASIATGIFSGVLSLVLQAYPPYSPEEIKRLILNNSQVSKSEKAYLQLPQLFEFILKNKSF